MSDELEIVEEFLQTEAHVPEVVDLTAAPQRLSKLLLIERLNATGLFEDALAALKADPYQYERWQASTTVDVDNEDVRNLLTAIGGDVEELLG